MKGYSREKLFLIQPVVFTRCVVRGLFVPKGEKEIKMKQSKQQRLTGLLWRILVSVIGLALILMALVHLLLFLFGETAAADVALRRFGGADTGKPPSARYQWSLDYTFTDDSGEKHDGHATRRGSDSSVKSDVRVYYFTFAPFLNTLESEAEPNLGQGLLIGVGLFLLVVMNKKRKIVVRKKGKFPPDAALEGTKIDDYDDSVEDVFHNAE